MSDLAHLRQRIDRINEQLLFLLNERAIVAKAIGGLKKAAGLSVYQPAREIEVLKKITAMNEGPLSDDQVQTIMQVIMQECRMLQTPAEIKILSKKFSLSLPLSVDGPVAYLGPEGTFTYLALVKCFGEKMEAISAPNMAEVVQKLVNEEVVYAVVPIENTTQGLVPEALDALLAASVSVVAEVILPIQFHLLMKDPHHPVKIIYSHAQALAQCQHHLNKFYHDALQVPVSSNAEGAARACVEEGAAALGNELIQQIYQLQIKQAHMEDFSNNQTRFLILGKALAEKIHPTKTMLLVKLAENHAGQLHKVLRVFAVKHLDMIWLVTRPDKVKPWEYVFVLEIRAAVTDEVMQEALAEVSAMARVQVLGSYASLNEVGHEEL